MHKLTLSLLCSTLLMAPAVYAGLPEALEAYNIKQYEAALPEFSYLADEGNDVALYYLGQMYRDGTGVPQDMNRAISYFKAASKAFNADASYQLGKMYATGTGVEKPDMAEAMTYYKKAAYSGNAEAMYELGEIYAKGEAVPLNNTYAFGYYLFSALHGNMKAEHKLGLMYLNGQGTPQDYIQGLKWLSRSAHQGYVLAQRDIADIRAANGSMFNPLDAYTWYSIIAAYNDDDIGKWAKERRDELLTRGLASKGEELAQRQKAATAWRPTPADKSVPKDEFNTTPRPVIPGFNDPQTLQAILKEGGILLLDGSRYGVTTDDLQQAMAAKDWTVVNGLVESSAKKGNVDAYTFMGDLMAKRMNDEAAAFKWYQKGADAGDGYAQYQLAKMYCEGRGTEPDIAACYKWLKTAEQKVTESLKFTVQTAIAEVEAKATPEELKPAQAAVTAEQKAAEKKDMFNLF